MNFIRLLAIRDHPRGSNREVTTVTLRVSTGKRCWSRQTAQYRADDRPETGQRRHPEQGITLLELVVAMGIFAVIIGIVFSFQQSGINAWKQGDVQTDLQQNVRVALDRIVRELRQAQQITQNGAQEIRFLNLDDQTIRYFLDGGEMKRTVMETGITTVVAGSLSGLSFTYDTDLRLVKIEVTSETREAQSYTLEVKVYLRNAPPES